MLENRKAHQLAYKTTSPSLKLSFNSLENLIPVFFVVRQVQTPTSIAKEHLKKSKRGDSLNF